MDGIKFELIDKFDIAVEKMNEAAIKFKSEDNLVMMCLTLGHLMNIHEDDEEYVYKLDLIRKGVADTLETPVDSLLEFFEKKIEISKLLIVDLQNLETDLNVDLNGHFSNEFSKLAVKLNVEKTLTKLKTQKPTDTVKKMKATLTHLLDSFNNPSDDLVFHGVENHAYVSSCVHRLKNAVLNIHGVLFMAFCGVPFQNVKKYSKEVNKFSFESKMKDPPTRKINSIQIYDSSIPKRIVQSNRSNHHSNMPFVTAPEYKHKDLHKIGRLLPRKYFNLNSILSRLSREIVKKGDILTKINLTSSGTLKKFTKVVNGNCLRWAKKEGYLSNVKNCHSYTLAEIKGVVLGRVTSAFSKSKNKNMEPWLCMSIILKNRSFDLYIPEEKIDFWYIGLSEFIREHNSKAYCMTKGQYLWKKTSLIMKHVIKKKLIKDKIIKANDPKYKEPSFCKAILKFNEFFNLNPHAKSR